MTNELRLLITLIGITIFIVILELIRIRKLREELSPIWILIGIAFCFSAFADRIFDPVAHYFGIHYPPLLLVVVLAVFLVIVALYFSVVISTLKSHNKELIQKTALIEFEIKSLKALVERKCKDREDL